VLSETGEVLVEQKLSTTPKAVKEVFGGMPQSRIALETGMHSLWVSRVLNEGEGRECKRDLAPIILLRRCQLHRFH
jgi:hypothetical protein